MRRTDIALFAAATLLILAIEAGNRTDVSAPAAEGEERAAATAALITCPLRRPELATVMQAAMLGDGTLIVEQQTATRVRHIKDC